MTRSIFLSAIALIVGFNSFGQIEGVVTNKQKAAITNAVIMVTEINSKKVDSVRSDQEGGYAFKGLKPGKYNVEARAEGFSSAAYKNIEVETAPEGSDEHDDTYYAVRVDIIMLPPDKK
jgi:hypothetical protein